MRDDGLRRVGRGAERGERGAHAAQFAITGGVLEEGVVGGVEGGDETSSEGTGTDAGRWRSKDPVQLCDGDAARDVAGSMAAHPIGDGEEACFGARQVGVLVAVPQPAAVGQRRDAPVQHTPVRRHDHCHLVSGIMRVVVILFWLSILAGCRPPAEERLPGDATAAVMAEIRPGMPLDEMLQQLDQRLALALQGQLEGEAVDHFRRAEAITDRLLEARLPFEWLTGEQYSLESRLRQIQSLADRVLAQLDTGTPRDTVMLELRLLRGEVLRLRETVAQGGGRAPTPLRELLADTVRLRQQATTRTEPAAAPPPTPTPPPLGTPVTTGG